VNTADLHVLRAIICESLVDPARQQACQQSAVIGPALHPVDVALGWLEVCRRIKWSLFTPPFSSASSFASFFQRLPEPLNTEIRVDGGRLSQQVGTNSRVVRVKAEGVWGKVTKRIEGVIDTSTGRYIYWKEN